VYLIAEQIAVVDLNGPEGDVAGEETTWREGGMSGIGRRRE
jgi:hypothetical protein